MKDFRRAMRLSASARRASAAAEGRLSVEEVHPLLPHHHIVVEPSTDAWHLVEETSTGLIGFSERDKVGAMWAKLAMGLVGRRRCEDTFFAIRQRFGLELWRTGALRPDGTRGWMRTALVGYPGMQIAMSWSRPYPRR